MSAYTSMTLPELLNHRDQISAEIFRQTGDASVVPISSSAASGGKAKLTKTGKVRKASANKGRPTARGDFTKKITAEHADDFAAYKEANPDLKGPHLSWYKHYIDQHKDEYEAFKTAWALEHPKESDVSLPPIPEEVVLAAPVAAPVAKLKAPKTVTKKAAAPAAAPAPVPVAVADAEPEELPFKHNGMTYIRIGVAKADGNHEWSSTDLWHSKKGKRAGYVGELMEDGSINEDAEEPALV